MSVRDSQCIRVVTPNDHVAYGFHEILLHDMGEEELPFVAINELDNLHRIWPRALFAFMTRYQQDLERKQRECKEWFGRTQSGNCTHVASIFRWIWESTLPFTTWSSRSCGAAQLCGVWCGRGLLRTVLTICGKHRKCRCQSKRRICPNSFRRGSYYRTVGGHVDAIYLRSGN